jgi:hypothetical protein
VFRGGDPDECYGDLQVDGGEAHGEKVSQDAEEINVTRLVVTNKKIELLMSCILDIDRLAVIVSDHIKNHFKAVAIAILITQANDAIIIGCVGDGNLKQTESKAQRLGRDLAEVIMYY